MFQTLSIWNSIVENLPTIIIGVLLATALFFAARSVYKKRKQGGCAGCSGCSGCSGCASVDVQECEKKQ